jgi:hypothetical protein
MRDVVHLRLPAGTDYGRVARVTTAALARRHGFSYREVEDLRLAVDESIIALIDDTDPGAAVDLHYEVEPGVIAITLDGASERPGEAVARFHTLVTGLVDGSSLDLGAGRARLTKRHHA